MVQHDMLLGMRPSGTPQQLEKRRRRAITLLQAGKSPAAVARAVSASRSSVQRWQTAYRKKGWAGLTAKPIPGCPSRLSARQKTQLERGLLKGPLAAGYPNDLWTLARIQQFIRKQFGVTYHPGHIWRLLHQMGWSSQKPEGRPLQRDEAAIRHWKRYRWPHIKKKPNNWARISFSSMKAAFYSFRMSSALGPHAGKRPPWSTTTNIRKSPL